MNTTNQIKIHKEDSFKKMRKAGSLAAECLDYIVDFIKPGITTEEINQLCHECKSQCIVEVNNSKKNKACAETSLNKDINLENQTRIRIFNCLVCDFSFFQDSLDT